MKSALFYLCFVSIVLNYVTSQHYPKNKYPDDNNNDDNNKKNEQITKYADHIEYMEADSTNSADEPYYETDDQKYNRKRRAVESKEIINIPRKTKTLEEMMAEDPLEGTSNSFVSYPNLYTTSTSSDSSIDYPNRSSTTDRYLRRTTVRMTDQILSKIEKMNMSPCKPPPNKTDHDVFKMPRANYTRPKSLYYDYNDSVITREATEEFIRNQLPITPDGSDDENGNSGDIDSSKQTRSSVHTAKPMDEMPRVRFHDTVLQTGRKMGEVPYYSRGLKRRLEGSNPYEPHYTVDYQEDGVIEPKCDNIDDIVADLEEYDFHVEGPIWRGYTFNTGSYNREELQIDEVVTEKRFYLNKQIIEWKSTNMKAIGRGDHGLSLISSHVDGLRVDNMETEKPVNAIEIFDWWDQVEHKLNTGVLLVQDAQISWNKFDDGNYLTPLWSWSLTYRIQHASIYNMDGEWKVAITHERVGDYQWAITIYGLELWKNWWVEQQLLGHDKPAVINNGRLMAVVHEDRETIVIYKYDYQLRRYQNFKNLTSSKVDSIVAFVIGSHSFLAIGGDNPVIYEIKGSEFQEKIIEHYKLEHIEQWLHVPLGYYRNDAILLFQHKLDHYTHSSSILEALQWNGEMFYILEHSPCRSHDEEMYGFSCILDAEGEKGIKGASIFQTFDENVNILTASEEHTPIMFQIKTQLIQVPDPVDKELAAVLKYKKHLQERLVKQQRILEQAEKMIKYASDKNEDVIFADNWKIDKIIAPSIRIDGKLRDTLDEYGYVNVAGQDGRNVDFNMDTTNMFDRIKNDHDRIRNIVNILKNAVMKKDGLPDTLNEVIINGNIEVRGKVTVDEAHVDFLNELHVDTVLENAVKKNKVGKLVIHGKIVLDELNADNINVESLNGINIVKNSSKKVEIDGDLHLLKHVNVLKDVKLDGTVNGIDFKTDIYTADNSFESDRSLNFDTVVVKNALKVLNTVNGFDFSEGGFKKLMDESRIQDRSLLKDELVLETLSVGKDINFDSINNKNWKNFMDNVIMKSGDVVLNDLTVNGTVKIGPNFKMKTLNDLTYPDDYFLLNEDTSSVFTSPKTFVDVLEVDEIDCEGLINGIKPEDIVTLSTRQHLDNFTFFDLTVTEKLNIQGNITGKELDAFLSNPKLTESDIIKSNVIFKNLRINGTLKVENRINGTNWNNLFDGVVMKSDKTVKIDSMKTFDGEVGIENDLNIRSGFINNRRVADFFTIDTDQMISSESLHGDIVFEELEVEGAFDNVNVTRLNDNVVTISDDQTFESNMIFDDDIAFDYDDRTLDIFDLNVKKQCNNWAVPDDVIFNDGKVLEVDSPQFDNLYVEHLIVEGDLVSISPINGIDLKEFNRIRLSKTETKTIISTYNIKNCSLNSVNFNKLNGISKYDVETFMNKLEKIDDAIKSGDIKIGTLHVTGKLNVDKINGIDLKQIADKAVWLKDDNYITGNLIFLDKVLFKNLQINENAYGVNFEYIMNDIVQIYNDPIKLTGLKTYKNGLNVLKNIKVDLINDVNVYNILSSENEQIITGNLYISGDLIVLKDLNVNKNINNIPIDKIGNSFEYIGDNEFILKGDFYLEEGAEIKNLIVNGLINDEYDLKNILNSTISRMDENYFDNTIIFNAPIFIKSDLEVIKTYNDINLPELLDSMVFKGQNPFIDSKLIFKYPVIVQGDLYVKKNMSCDLIQYCSVQEWLSNSIFLNEPSDIGGIKTFENLVVKGDIKTNILNGIPFDRYVTLHSEQTLSKGLNFDVVQIEDELFVDGAVNNIRLDEEFQNILKVNEYQDLNSPMHFHSDVFVNKDAFIGFINGIDAKKIVNLNSDQTLEGNYNFYGNVSFLNNLNVYGPISDIDMDSWMRNAVYKNDYADQVITGNWNITGNVQFHDRIDGKILLNGLSKNDINDYLDRKSNIIAGNEEFYNVMYKQICNNIDYINDVMKKRIHLFKYMEEVQIITNLDLLSAYHFNNDSDDFLILSNKWECDGYLWRLDKSENRFKKFKKVNVGCPVRWYTMWKDGFIFLLSIGDDECDCTITDTTVWIFDGINIKPIKSLKSVESVSVPRESGGKFYGKIGNVINQYVIIGTDEKYEVIENSATVELENGKFILSNHELLKSIVTNGNRIVSLDNNQIIQVENRDLLTVDEIVEFKVGRTNRKVSATLKSQIKENNYITIYEDILKGVELQRIPCYEPSSLTVIQPDDHQTLLLFVENKTRILVYTYKGFAGFQQLYRLDMPADKITQITEDLLMIIGDGTISIIQPVMYGKRKIDPNVICSDILSRL